MLKNVRDKLAKAIKEAREEEKQQKLNQLDDRIKALEEEIKALEEEISRTSTMRCITARQYSKPTRTSAMS